MPLTRMRGACARCVRGKRRCDQTKPSCSQCLKTNSHCEPRTFRHWVHMSNEDGASRSRRAKAPGAAPRGGTLESCDGGVRQPDMTHQRTHSVQEDPVVPSALQRTATLEGSEQTCVVDVDGMSVSSAIFVEPVVDVDEMGDVNATFTEPVLDASVPAPFDSPQRATVLTREIQPRLQTRSLSILPDELQNSDVRLFLWKYFLQACETEFLCWDATDELQRLHSTNLVSSSLLPMAVFSAPLMSATLSLAAQHYSFHTGQEDFMVTTRLLRQEALQHLASTASNSSTTSPDTLAIVAAASLLHMMNFQDSGNLLALARSAAACFITQAKSTAQLNTASYQLTMSLLRWADICTLVSLRRPEMCFNLEVHHMIEPNHDASYWKQVYQGFQEWMADPIYAFSPRLVRPLMRLGRLHQMRFLVHTAGKRLIPEHEFKQQVTELEEDLLLARENDREASLEGTTEPEELLHLNEAMYATAFLLFYARLHEMPMTHPLIRQHVQIIVSESALIRRSRTAQALLFPLFIAGCEAVDTVHREAISERLGLIPSDYRNPRGLGKDCLKDIWDLRDIEPGLTWPEWTERVPTRCQNFFMF